MRVVVCTPWIEARCTWRTKSRDWTAAFWASLGVPVVYGLDTSKPTNRSRARNNASRCVVADVVFFADADMWVPEAQFTEACERAYATGTLVHAYTLHTRLTKQSTLATLDGTPMLQGQTVRNAPHGAIAVPTSLLAQVGGHDERFEGWGYEDRCFQFACDTIGGPGSRVEGWSYHLYHPRGQDQSITTMERRSGRVLAQRYKQAAGVKKSSGILRPTKDAELNRQAMLDLLAEDGGPLRERAIRATLP